MSTVRLRVSNADATYDFSVAVGPPAPPVGRSWGRNSVSGHAGMAGRLAAGGGVRAVTRQSGPPGDRSVGRYPLLSQAA